MVLGWLSQISSLLLDIMPELPEVETIRRQLIAHLPVNIQKVRYSTFISSILKTNMFCPKGKTLRDIHRKGKVLDFIFQDENHMLCGLGMSGGWRVDTAPITDKHTHIQWEGKNATGKIYFGYVDPRRFGTCHLLDAPSAKQRLSLLGVDIGTRAFTADYVKKVCQRSSNREIKPFLLDQKFFAGVGNYLACEICAHARIHPTRKAGTLTTQEHQQIVAATKRILRKSLKNRGLSFSGGYADTTGTKGDALNQLVVFHQSQCGLCEQTPVEKIVLKGRGTYYCPHCQK